MSLDASPSSAPWIDVVLPCLDEAASLPWILARMPHGCRPIVVDNGSGDGSPEIARALGATVVHQPTRGYGAAVHAGVCAARADYVAVMDCDGSLDPADLPRLTAPVREGRADLVVGRRRPVDRAAWSWHARFANRLLAAVITRTTGTQLNDIAPFRVGRRVGLLALDVTDRRCGYPLETLLSAAARGWRILELDVTYGHRTAGSHSKVSGTVRGTSHTIQDFGCVLWARSRAGAR